MEPQRNFDQVSVQPAFIGIVVLLVLVLVVGAKSYSVVEAGSAGIVKRFGKIIGEPHSEGLVWIIPFAEKVILIDIRTQKLLVRARASSNDLQSVDCEIVLNYSPIFDEVGNIYQKIGVNYEEKKINPALHEAFKSVTATYNAEELITRRQQVREAMERDMKGVLLKFGVKLEALSIQDFSFSSTYSEAIEMKQVAEQNALRAENELKRVTTEQQQEVEKAKAQATALEVRATAEAKAIKIRAEAEAEALELLAKSAKPSALQARTIEKWNGMLPKVTGGATPFLDVQKFVESKN